MAIVLRQKLVLWSLVVSIFFFLSAAAIAAGVVKNLSPEESYELLKQRGDEIFLLDVRTPGEYQQVRLAGAKLIPIDQLLQRMDEVPKNKPLLVYCAVGSRSSQVVGYMARIGYPEVYNLYGGIYAWSKKVYPVLQGLP
ncbi:MAG: rhodanese-like domain-containing protein [Desulfuromonas sp.]|nr:MAG: rhodanese-like domain-containing protein [Desulfuromonas sp.]